ncbi:hypothetical protein [Spirobacillus cienkowskii]|uniref:hypothetical protein n=1 Tax=Spirobacillus cienkowskii TaxID=495820 RepID=UPI0030D1D1B1
MNSLEQIFKLSLYAYINYLNLKLNHIKQLNEKEFYNIIINNFNKYDDFFNNTKICPQLINTFLSQAQILCEYEAMTFMPDDLVEEYNNTKINIEKILDKIFYEILSQKNFNQEELNLLNRRLFIGFVNTFKEWTEDIKFFKNNDNDKFSLLQESPLISLCLF